MANALQFCLHIGDCGDIAMFKMPEIELHARLNAPIKWHFINAPGRLATRHQPFIHAAEIMIGRVNMRAVMGADLNTLNRGIFAFGQLIYANAEILRHARRGHVVIQIFDLWQRMGRVTDDAGLECDGNINNTTGHGVSPSFEIKQARQWRARWRRGIRQSRWKQRRVLQRGREKSPHHHPATSGGFHHWAG